MKHISLLMIVVFIMVFGGCTGPGKTATVRSEHQNTITNDGNAFYRNLADYLRRVSGVIVRGSGDNVSVKIHGINSFSSDTTPLFVIDGHAIGNSYQYANSILIPQDIDRVRVLKGPAATIYGIRGGNGVIEIYTKRA